MHLLRKRFRPGLEALEDRALPSSSRLPFRDLLPPSSPATQLRLVAPESITVGRPFTVLVAALQDNNLPAFGFTGTVRLTSSDTAAKLPADPYTFKQREFGVHAFQVGLNTVGSQTLIVSTVTDNAAAVLTTSVTIDVQAAPVATQFRILMPSNLRAGREAPVTVVALDANSRPVVDYVGTISLTSTDSSTVTDYTFTTRDRGSHTFRMTFQNAGEQSVTATDKANAALTATATTQVEAAPVVTQFRLEVPANVRTGVAAPLVVVAVDANGRPVTNYTGTVQFTSSDANAVLPAEYTFKASDRGRQVLRVTFQTEGTQSVSVADKANAALTGSDETTVAPSPVATRFAVLVSSVARPGVPTQVLVVALDANNRPVPNYTGTVHFSVASGDVTLPADYTFKAEDRGSHRFQVTFKTTGQFALTVADTTNASLTGQVDLTVRDIRRLPWLDALLGGLNDRR